MALTTDIRVFPQKEMFAIDMAEVLDAVVIYSCIIQGCGITFNPDAGTLTVDSGRILIRGRLCVITEGGDLAAPVVSGTSDVTCYLVAACNLSTVNPFSVEIITPATYEEYQQRKAASADTFNVQEGFDFILLGTVVVNPTSGKITTWTPRKDANAKTALEINANNSGGSYLPAGTNINNLTKIHSGCWVYARSEVSGTFPISDTYGTICHIQGTSDNVGMQIIRSNSQSATDRVIYVRYKIGGTWGAWQRYISTRLTQLNVVYVWNRYIIDTGLSQCTAYKKGGTLFFRGKLSLNNEVPAGTSVQIGTITGWSSPVGIIQNVPSAEYGNEQAAFSVTYDGKIQMVNNTGRTLTVGNNYSFSLSAPCSDGSE